VSDRSTCLEIGMMNLKIMKSDLPRPTTIKFRRPELLEDEATRETEIPVTVKIMVDGPIVIKGNLRAYI